MFNYNEVLDNDKKSGLLFDNQNRSIFGAPVGGDGNPGENHEKDLLSLLKKSIIFIVCAISCAIGGMLCIFLGGSELMILIGFALFACTLPLSAFVQFACDRFFLFLQALKNKIVCKLHKK